MVILIFEGLTSLLFFGPCIATDVVLGLTLTRLRSKVSVGAFAAPSIRWFMNTVVGHLDAVRFQLTFSTVSGRPATEFILLSFSFREAGF